MELKEFIPSYIKSSKPLICLNKKNGLVTFNTSLCRKLNLTEGDIIKLYHNLESPGDWYLRTHLDNGISLRKLSSTGALGFGSRLFVEQIIDSISLETNNRTIRVPVSCEIDPESGCYALLTSSLKM